MQTERKITEKDLKLILELKNKGWSFLRLARKYKCHHSAVMYYFRRLGITDYPGRRKHKEWKRFKNKKIPPTNYIEETREQTRPLKSYKEYIADEARRLASQRSGNQDAIARARNRIVDTTRQEQHNKAK